MGIKFKPFGVLSDQTAITLYTLENKNGLRADIMDYGGIIVSLYVPDRDGKTDDITLGYDTIEDYLDRSPYFGALVGRHANRIEQASFILNGVRYELNSNEGKNHIHGGISGFDKKVWDSRIIEKNGYECLELSLFSPDGEEGYPGNLEVRVIYSLTDDNSLEIEYYSAADKDTVLNMTNHAYFNLSGHDSGTILDHCLKINADFYTPINKELLPTGEILSVKNTPFDFTESRPIGDGLRDFSGNEQMMNGSGYDHNFVLRGFRGEELKECCELYDPKSGRVMTCLTTKPGVQFYSGNFLDSAGVGKGGHKYEKWHGLCLETQYFPNSMKHGHFPSPILRAGQTYHHLTIYRFSTR
ncbi:MAG TPA: galactose mutarotase [Clostridiaceae bacterium]|nr:galactose mutarotase [Clostridiaceae bacterium]